MNSTETPLRYLVSEEKIMVLRKAKSPTHSRRNDFSRRKSKAFAMVEMRGVEPLSENPSERTSTSVVCYFGKSHFPLTAANRHAAERGRL